MQYKQSSDFFPFILPPSWETPLLDELNKPYIQELKLFLNREFSADVSVFPPRPLIFNALFQCPYESVRVVIMGQDPYHGKGQAHGLSFSVSPGVTPPPSLKNIYKEIERDLKISPPDHGFLLNWARQGVLLLNATLTVREKSPKSHYGQGWELFTDAIIRALALRKDPLVFMLWGKSAQEKYEHIASQISHNHLILQTSHPSPYSANNGFLGSGHFSKANAFLERVGGPIDWSL